MDFIYMFRIDEFFSILYIIIVKKEMYACMGIYAMQASKQSIKQSIKPTK